jgi:hypothetical protein
MLKNIYAKISFIFVLALVLSSLPLIPVSGFTSLGYANEVDINPDLTLDEFSAEVSNGVGSQIVGVFAEENFAYPIIQQPVNNPAFVSTEEGKVTQFATASRYGSIGLIAHNTLAGADFSLLQVGDVITLVYGDGSARTYSVTQIKQFQALSPTNPYSAFKDLEDPSTTLSVATVFTSVYAVTDRLVLQTCIAKDGIDSWGRLFVIAEPVELSTAQS